MRNNRFLIVLFTLILSACSSLQTPPTITPTFTATLSPVPSTTNTPANTATFTVTLKPTKIVSPTITGTLPTKMPGALRALLPKGKAVSEWEGFPIMPNAIEGEETKSAAVAMYTFTVKGSVDAVKNYYMAQMPRINWRFLSEHEGGALGNRILEFQKGIETIQISIVLIDETERIVMVTIIKQ
jgi:hypothetical protein